MFVCALSSCLITLATRLIALIHHKHMSAELFEAPCLACLVNMPTAISEHNTGTVTLVGLELLQKFGFAPQSPWLSHPGCHNDPVSPSRAEVCLDP